MPSNVRWTHRDALRRLEEIESEIVEGANQFGVTLGPERRSQEHDVRQEPDHANMTPNASWMFAGDGLAAPHHALGFPGHRRP